MHPAVQLWAEHAPAAGYPRGVVPIVDILYSAFDYRGTSELFAHLSYQSRAELRPVLTSFTPEDVTKVMVARGYSLVSNNDDEDAPVLQFRTRGVLTSVGFHHQVPDQNLFETIVLTCTIPTVSDDEFGQVGTSNESGLDLGIVDADVGSALSFTGGVTAEWLSSQVEAWTNMIVDRQHQVTRKRRVRRRGASPVVH
jgi:hypothetical protein